MSHRSVSLTLVAVSLLAGMMNASAVDPPAPARPELPRANCPKRLVDGEGDAKPYGTPNSNPALDLNGVHMRLTQDQLQVFLSVKDLKAPTEMDTTDGRYAYIAEAKFGTKTAFFRYVQTNEANEVDDPRGGTTYSLWGSLLGASDSNIANTGTTNADALPGFTAVAYPEANVSYVIFTVPRQRLEQNLGGALKEGDKFGPIKAYTELRNFSLAATNSVLKPLVDQLDVPEAQAVYTVGDDYCFGPVPAKVSDLVAPAVQYTDSVTLSAKLTTEAGAALAGKPVHFEIAGESAPLTTKTDSNGVAKVTYTPKRAAGVAAVVARFPGDAEQGTNKAIGTITINPEVTMFSALTVTKPSAATRKVTATLLDNDRKPVGNQKIEWWVNNKKVGPGTTDASGRAVYTKAKPGQTVQARFAGVTGKYLKATSASRKV